MDALIPRRAVPPPRPQDWSTPPPPGHEVPPQRRVVQIRAICVNTTSDMGSKVSHRNVGTLLRVQYSQSSVNDDGVGLDREAENPGIFRCIPEDDLLALCVLLREKADFRDAVVLWEDIKHPQTSSNGAQVALQQPEGADRTHALVTRKI